MSALFNLNPDDGDEPPLIRLDTLAESRGIEPAHLIGDSDCPIVVTIGAGRYISRTDLDRLLLRRAEAGLARRRSGAVPEPYASDLAAVVRKATADDRFYRPEPAPAAAEPASASLRERSEREPEPAIT